MRVCICGSGMGGATLALELARIPEIDVVLLDCDRIAERYSSRLELEKSFSPPLRNQKTTAFGFGGTSNLWQGVLTDFDDEDWKEINDLAGVDIHQQLGALRERLVRYFGDISSLASVPDDLTQHQLAKFLNMGWMLPKHHIVQMRPTRFRKLIRRAQKKENVQLIQGAVVTALKAGGDSIESIEYTGCDGERLNVQADVYVIALGALETPRLLLQSFGPRFPVGIGLMDHPIVFIGEITTPQAFFYHHHGKNSFWKRSSLRVGFRITNSARTSKNLNHSLFIRPSLMSNGVEIREQIRKLLTAELGRSVLAIIGSKDLRQAAFTLLLEKLGFGAFTNKFLVSVQLEQQPLSNSMVRLSNETDKHGRMQPIINREFEQNLISDIKHIQDQFGNTLKGGAEFEEFEVQDYQHFLSGSHYAGTSRLGSDPESAVVDANLKHHDFNNLYVCDASVLPKIGNANLTLTLSGLATRLSDVLAEKSRE